MGAFGEKLRKQREQRGIELDAISNTTKISARMLRAIEDEHFDQLPGGVFNKGFIRAYARQVGLDEEEVVADYLAALRENEQQSLAADVRSPAAKPSAVAAGQRGDNVRPSSEVAANPSDAGYNEAQDLRHEERRKRSRRDEDRHGEDRVYGNKFQKYPAGDPAERADQSSTPIPWGKLALALVLVTLVLVLWNFRRQARLAPASQPAPSSNQSPAPATAPSSANAGTPPVGKSSRTISAATTPPHIEPASTAASPTASTAGSARNPAPEPDANLPSAKATTLAATAKPPRTFTLLIRAEETTWVSLTADGKPVAHETLIAPAHTAVRAAHEIVVKAGNAAGISFVLNGKEIPAQGNEGEVKTFTFDSTGLQTAPQPQPPATNR